MRTLVLATVIALLGSGCYTGRTAGAKHTNYVINGALAIVGTAIMIGAANSGESSCSDDASCVGGAMGAAGGAAIGALLLGGGLVGIGITAIVPTKVPDPLVIER